MRPLRDLLDDERTLNDVARYFSEQAPAEERFSGRRFESLAGGGDRAGCANRLTSDDLVAVTLLSVRVPGAAAIELLEGRTAGRLSTLLAQIPTGLALADDRAADIVASGSPADEAWHVLTSCTGVGWVTAAKLLARKRPQLLPVYDDVIRCVVRQPERLWTALRDALRADGHALERRLADVRTAAGLAPSVSTLRVLDVAIWMRHHDEHRSKNCRPDLTVRGAGRVIPRRPS